MVNKELRMVQSEFKAYIVIIEPGDMTKYQFCIIYKEKGRILVASISGPRFDGYDYSLSEIIEYINNTHEKRCEESINSYIQYIVDHSNCNPWTAVAMCKAVYELNKNGLLEKYND